MKFFPIFKISRFLYFFACKRLQRLQALFYPFFFTRIIKYYILGFSRMKNSDIDQVEKKLCRFQFLSMENSTFCPILGKFWKTSVFSKFEPHMAHTCPFRHCNWITKCLEPFSSPKRKKLQLLKKLWPIFRKMLKTPILKLFCVSALQALATRVYPFLTWGIQTIASKLSSERKILKMTG